MADDATGALETGARFREAGLDARVSFDPGLAWSSGALVVDTETRHLPAEQARERVRAIATRAKQSGVAHIYKKTDSTLRGPIAAEFRALLGVWPELPLVYAPAYPALGRTVRNGELYVDGKPLSQTPFAADPLNPSRESSIAALLGATGAEVMPVRSSADLRAALCRGRVLVCDGEADADLEFVAAAVRDAPCIMAGTAAMASAWAASLSRGKRRVWKPPSAALTCLVVNGSLHPASREQLAISSIPMLAHSPAADPVALGTRLAGLIERSRWAALCASPPCTTDPLAVAAHVARAAAHAVRLAAPDCLMVFGGDTVFAIMRELAIGEAEPHTEILPGAAVSTIWGQGTARPMLLITKAGGFGGPDYLARIRGILERV